MTPDPVFFELSWSILSTIGAANVFFGLLVVSITSFSPIAAVPIITSAAGAIANGLCYYAFYLTSPPVTNRAVASAFADILWLVQEVGLSFYSYIILSRILRDKHRYIFAGLFWTIVVALVAVRIVVAITRVRLIVGGDSGLQDTINYLHMTYFPLIAVLECVSAYYLLTTFANAKSNSLKHATKTGLFKYLMRSTEVRLALLAVVGIMRAITYSFQATTQSATNTASQVDRFAYTLECLFPIIMLIDMLSSKVVSTNQSYNLSSHSRPGRSSQPRQFVTGGKDSITFPTSRAEHVVEVHGGAEDSGYGRTSSQERIFRDESFGMAASDVDLGTMDSRRVGINKTVEFEVEVSESRSESTVTCPLSA